MRRLSWRTGSNRAVRSAVRVSARCDLVVATLVQVEQARVQYQCALELAKQLEPPNPVRSHTECLSGRTLTTSPNHLGPCRCLLRRSWLASRASCPTT